ncbi:hypothetical protein H2198_009949 [Neophaeococcomyces mojaviensis]|uniref:Uncharacterized protein n=1 Tax=Neophaeococcomyces mojaviensis TaxID=3383035 RepID=A0ACC2ZT36_9EURO|nr:hypothetical protein H2198_009949 [Knufia sp. JES_112]
MADQGISESARMLVPKDPASSMSIRDIVLNQITTLSTPFLRFGIIKVGGRATIIKLKTGNLAVFSPVALTAEVKAKVAQLSASSPSGTVKYLVAPDIEHHIFLSPWANEYKDVNIIGMEGLPEKREKDPNTRGLKFRTVFTPSNKNDMRITKEFDDEFEYEYVHSHQNKELVFFHKPTRTLIEADVVFNLPATEQFSMTGEDPNGGISTKLFGSVTNTRGNMIWQKRFLWYGPGSSDRKGFAASAKKMYEWGEFDRMIPCHGDVIEKGGSRILNNATAWFRENY